MIYDPSYLCLAWMAWGIIVLVALLIAPLLHIFRALCKSVRETMRWVNGNHGKEEDKK